MHLDPTARTVLWAIFDLSRRGAQRDARHVAKRARQPLSLTLAALARLDSAGLADAAATRLTMHGLVSAACLDGEIRREREAARQARSSRTLRGMRAARAA